MYEENLKRCMAIVLSSWWEGDGAENQQALMWRCALSPTQVAHVSGGQKLGLKVMAGDGLKTRLLKT
jgi:hypothetical protein